MIATAKNRRSLHLIMEYGNIMHIIKNSGVIHRRWFNYQKDFDYAKNVSFNDTCDEIEKIMNVIFITEGELVKV